MPEGRKRRVWPRLLFVIPFLFVPSVPFYNRLEPDLFGIPFFYWSQLSFVLIGAVIVLLVYRLEGRGAPER